MLMVSLKRLRQQRYLELDLATKCDHREARASAESSFTIAEINFLEESERDLVDDA